jgi:hypothetical protein
MWSLIFLTIVTAQLLIATCLGQAPIDISKSATEPITKTNWLQFGFTAAGARYNPYENVLGPSNVSGLVQKFSVRVWRHFIATDRGRWQSVLQFG